MTRKLSIVILLTISVFLSLASNGQIVQGSECCVCLEEKSCLPVDENECADEIGKQIGGDGTKVQINKAGCQDECSQCEGFEFEVVEYKQVTR